MNTRLAGERIEFESHSGYPKKTISENNMLSVKTAKVKSKNITVYVSKKRHLENDLNNSIASKERYKNKMHL